MPVQSMSHERYLRAMPDGSLLLVSMKKAEWDPNPKGGRGRKQSLVEPPSDRFRLRQLEMVPKFFGPSLGGWLVAEAWMCPAPLFDGVFQGACSASGVKALAEKYCL